MTKKLYYEDVYLRECNANIVDFGNKDGRYFAVLDQTIFYAEGGGQPPDQGYINNWKVVDVQEIDGKLLHFLEGDTITAPQLPASAFCRLDWDRRLDHMQQHTAQHLLSGNAYLLYEAQTMGFHLGSEETTVDYSLPSFSDEQLAELERATNAIIAQNCSIRSFFPTETELNNMELRKDPLDYDEIRIVSVEGLDNSPCGGTHHESSSEVQLIKIIKQSKMHGRARIHILAGSRAIRHYAKVFRIADKLGTTLNVPIESLHESVEKLLEDQYLGRREINNLSSELAVAHWRSEAIEPILNGSVHLRLQYNANIENRGMESIAEQIKNAGKMLTIVYNPDTQGFLATRSDDLEIDMRKIKDELAQKYSIRGGGNSTAIRGKAEFPEKESLRAFLKLILQKLLS